MSRWLMTLGPSLLFHLVPCNFVDGCSIHQGFSNAWDEVAKDIEDAGQSALLDNPGYSLVVTGHSLGGAVATLAGVGLRRAGFSCDVYTYGSPRIGNTEFATFASNQNGLIYRVTHTDDPVLRLPLMTLDYRHTDVQYWLSSGEYYKVNYELADIQVCLGIDNSDCNAYALGGNHLAHDYYF